MAKKNFGNSKKPPNNRGNMKAQLAAIKVQMDLEDPSYNIEQQEKQKQINENWGKLMGILPDVYDFMRGYKFNSGIFLNNFWRGRSFAQYEEDKWEEFTMDVFPKEDPFMFGHDDYAKIRSHQIITYLHELDRRKIAYHPINTRIIELLKKLEEAFELHPPVERVDQILYRGCTSLERNGLNGIVSTSADMAIALQFSRGTLLKINVPEGTPWIDVAKIRAKKRRPPKDFENEFLLRPCKYVVGPVTTIDRGAWGEEPNNRHSQTKVIEVTVIETVDLLEDFLKVMENPPEEFMGTIYPYIKEDFDEAKSQLKEIIEERSAK